MCLTPASTSLSPTCHSRVLGPQSHYAATLARHTVKCTSALNPNHKWGVLCVQGQENLPSILQPHHPKGSQSSFHSKAGQPQA